MAATFNPDAAHKVGRTLGTEVKDYGLDVLLAPGVNPVSYTHLATIVYSYIGYLTQEKKAVAGVMNGILKEDTKTLDEVVVVGYGVQKKSSLTGAVSSVKSEDMEARTITRAEQALHIIIYQ